MPGTKPRGTSSGRLSTINPDAAGIDIGATFHVVAVPSDRDDRPVRTFRTFSGAFSRHRTLATMLMYRDEHDRMATQRQLADVVAATLTA